MFKYTAVMNKTLVLDRMSFSRYNYITPGGAKSIILKQRL